MNFEESIARLNEIVKALQSGDLSIDDSLKLYEEGSKLSNDCIKILDEAESRITKINSDGSEEEFTDEA